MKKFDNQIMKFTITKDKLKMEMTLKDLEWLFHNSPNNTYNGESVAAKVKRGKRQEFAEYIVKMLLDDSPYDENHTRWGQPFADAFTEIFEGYEDFCKYSNNDEDE